MKKFGLLSSSAMGSAALFGLSVAFAAPAYAQDTNNCTAEQAAAGTCTMATAEAQAPEAAGQTVEVTGTRIRRPDLESTVPITSIAGESLFQQGDTNIGDTLNELPQLRSTFAQQNPGLGVGIAGLNLLDLRGLGTARTLVLVNGRRHVAADILNNAVSVDINTIPNDLIERVDIVTGGNSAIYGSDAIAGVVNFILRRNFEGLQVRAQAGISTPGNYGANTYVSAMYGMNFGDGRGNVTLHAEWAHQDRVYASDIPFLGSFDSLGIVDADPAGLVQGSDGLPDAVLIRNQTLRSISRTGLAIISQPVAAPGCGVGVSNGVTPGIPYNCLLVFQADGTVVPSTEVGRFSTGPIGGAIGGNLNTGREGTSTSVLPQQDRYNFNLLAHYEFAPALEAFLEAKYVRIDTQGSNAGSRALQGTFGTFDYRERMRLDNPFLTAQARGAISAAILASGCNTALTIACSAARATFAGGGITQGREGPLNQADRDAIAAGTYRFALARDLVDAGIRDELFRRETYRFVGGFRGTFWDDWNYEVSVNYGRTKEHTFASGYFDKQRVDLSLDAARNPVTGQIQCRSQFEPAAAVARTGASAGNAARLAADIAACVPYNPFGSNADNSAATAYFSHPYEVDAHISQLVVSGFVSGDTSSFFNLPGGPVRFALGAEYRRESPFYQQDEFGASGDSTAVAFGGFDPDAFKVKEAYGELQLPLLRDMPFAHELTLSGAGRVARYQGGTGTVWSYNAGVDWAPIRDVRFRANYSRAVRAPNLTETFGELIPNFAPGFNDPCSPTRIGAGTQFRPANCQAALGANLPNLANLGTISLGILSGVNPNLQAETSDSYTYGVVIQPRIIPGLAVSVDYYNIRVNGVITSLAAQTIVDSCYDQPTLQNPFCDLFARFAGPGTGPANEFPGRILENSLISAPFNFARRVRRGIDTNVTYRTRLGDNVRFEANLIYSHNLQDSNFENPADPTFENVIRQELGDPKDEFRLDTNLSIGAFTFGYRVRYIGPMYTGAYENYNSVGGRAPQNSDATEPRFFDAVTYHDIRIEWDLAGHNGGNFDGNFKFFAGVDNVLNREPPLGVSGTGNASSDRTAGGAAIYSVRGRQFYAGFRARF